MTVKELIAELNKCEPELRVVASGYEGGLTDVTPPDALTIALDVNDDWYYGKHEEIICGDEYPNAVKEIAIRIA